MSAELRIAHISKEILVKTFHKRLNLTRQPVLADGQDLSQAMSIAKQVKSGILITLTANSVNLVTSWTLFLTTDLVKIA